MDAGLRASYEACRRMQRRHDPTYYWATRRLPADVRSILARHDLSADRLELELNESAVAAEDGATR